MTHLLLITHFASLRLIFTLHDSFTLLVTHLLTDGLLITYSLLTDPLLAY